MGKIVERRKKKKKGRPSLLDLQKRSLKDQQPHQHQHQHQHQQKQKRTSNPNFKTSPITPNPSRRSTRRNPTPDGESPEVDSNEASVDEDDELSGKRREKKLKLVLKLPSSLNSTSLNSVSYNSESNADDNISSTKHKKRKINAIGDGSGQGDSEKEEKHVYASKPTKVLQAQGTQVDMGPSTPLPDKMLLLFILDRLQKKDTYSVFSEPVDPNELPDYHEIVEHPMDFGTVRKKLASGAYANLEQFEKDVFLICSNAMQYNSSDTVYFRQARSIQELAKKNFENLRQDSDDNKTEQKIVRRGRPPTKNLKKQMLRPSLERAGSEFSLDAILATGTENTTWSNSDLKKGPLFDKSGPADFSGRSFRSSRNTEPYSGWLAELKFERNNELTGSILKGNWMKNGKKQVVFDENRRNTYKSPGGREPSVLTTFDGERKQLTAVGLHSEYGYSRSLARFAANLGPVAWNVASKKIEKSLPVGVNFGLGWVGENEAVPPRPLLVLPSRAPIQLSSSQSCSLPGISCKPSTTEMRGDKSLEDPEGDNLSEKRMPSTHSDLDSHPGKSLLSSPPTSSSPIVANRSTETISERAEAAQGLNSHSGFNMPSGSVGVIRPGQPFQGLQNPVFRRGMNGFNGVNGFNFPAQMGKLTGSIRPSGINFQSSRIDDTISRANSSVVHLATANGLTSEDSKLLGNTGRSNSNTSLPNSGREDVDTPKMGHQHPASWQEAACEQQKPDSVPPDLNIRFRTPGSPNSSRVDSAQPDLVLQL